MNTDASDRNVHGQDLFDAIVEAYREYDVVISMPGCEERNIPDFDYKYSVKVVSPEFGEAALVAVSDGGPAFIKVSTTEDGSDLEMYDVERGSDYTTTYIGNVYSVREAERY